MCGGGVGGCEQLLWVRLLEVGGAVCELSVREGEFEWTFATVEADCIQCTSCCYGDAVVLYKVTAQLDAIKSC